MRRAGAVASGREPGAAVPACTWPAWSSFTFPTPPSLNTAYKNVAGRGRVGTPRLDEWKREAAWNIRADFNGQTIDGDFVARLHFERTDETADLDNRVKLALDALVRESVVVDDRFAVGLAAAWLPASPDHPRPRAFVSISKATPFAARFLPLGAGRGGWFIDEAGDGSLPNGN